MFNLFLFNLLFLLLTLTLTEAYGNIYHIVMSYCLLTYFKNYIWFITSLWELFGKKYYILFKSTEYSKHQKTGSMFLEGLKRIKTPQCHSDGQIWSHKVVPEKWIWWMDIGREYKITTEEMKKKIQSKCLISLILGQWVWG